MAIENPLGTTFYRKEEAERAVKKLSDTETDPRYTYKARNYDGKWYIIVRYRDGLSVGSL